jgi:hypothetical protein
MRAFDGYLATCDFGPFLSVTGDRKPSDIRYGPYLKIDIKLFLKSTGDIDIFLKLTGDKILILFLKVDKRHQGATLKALL